MSLNLALSSALSGLQTSQKGLDLVSRNIANVNTVGYTKKIFNQESRILNGTGSGVQVTAVTRRVDVGLIKELNLESAKLEEYSIKDEYFQRMQDLFGKPSDNNSIAHRIATLAEEIETLALEPDKTEQHLTTVQRAEDVALKLNSMGDRLQELRLDADQDIDRTVDEVNTLLFDIQNLNEEIAYALATGKDGTDLTDQRDQAVKELTALMDITTFERGSGEITVYTRGGSILVDREVNELSASSLSAMTAWQTKGGEDIQGIMLGAQDITDDIGAGKLAALIELRDSTLSDYQAQIDELTRALKDTVNLVNNRGTSFPNLATEYSGTRQFIDTSEQQIALDDDHDVVVGLFDADGTQVATTTFKGEGILDTTLTDLDAVAADLQTWLQGAAGGVVGAATVSFNSDNKIEITLNDNNYSLAFKDVETGTTTASDAVISFDADGDGSADSTHTGFANFLGLNDLYTAPRTEWAWDSGIKASGWNPFTSGTLTFSQADSGGTLTSNSLSFTGNETIQQIANKINGNSTLAEIVEAEVVSEGEGERLRIKSRDGHALAVTGTASLLESLGMRTSNAALSNDITIKQEIVNNPSLISRGSMLFNEDTGEYQLSAGDNSTANALADAMRKTQAFEKAGKLPGTSRSLVDHASLTLSLNASQTSSNETRYDYQLSLVDTLTLKTAEISAVNMDEELAQLIVFEKSYAASAKVISTTAELFDILNSIV